jgi:hypothetical protein
VKQLDIDQHITVLRNGLHDEYVITYPYNSADI